MSTVEAPPQGTEWSPVEHLRRDAIRRAFALIILNVPIVHQGVHNALANAAFVICADGGANRLTELYASTSGSKASQRMPDVIVGDLDSIRPEVQRFYEDHGVQVIQVADQVSTDLTKCLRHVNACADSILAQYRAARLSENSHQPLDVMILGSTGDRVDQGFATLQGLLAASHDPALCRGRAFLYSPQNLTFVLRPGPNRILTPLGDGLLAKHVGIIPLMGPARISTSGLEWDVSNWTTQFGGQVSTSNHIRRDSVEVRVEQGDGVLFTVELAQVQHGSEVRS